ncbi:MAG: UDP-glucose 4-epimerase GalE [Candidatus Sulfotelmatobacter sp.]
MRVLVTGGAGYIGSVVVAELVSAGHEVVVYDDLSKGHRRAVSAQAELIVGNLEDRPRLSDTFLKHKFEAVMHFAASIEAGESMKTPSRYFRNNTANAVALLEQVAEHSVSRLVFSSTAALYGNPERSPILESDVLQPTNVYGESKLLVERMLPWFYLIHGLSYASLRYFNAAGATAALGEMHTPETHLIPILLQVAAGRRDNVTVFGTDFETPDGTCVRDYIHVSDLASAHLLALNALAAQGDPKQLIYNLGSGRGFSVRQVIEVARKVTEHSIPSVDAPRRPGDPAILVASSEKIRRELGWKPKYPELDTVVRSAWSWFQRHPSGYED